MLKVLTIVWQINIWINQGGDDIMGWNFRKSVRLGKVVRLNLSKRGVGISAGVKGLRLGVNRKGIYTSSGIPGTGLYRRDYLSKTKNCRKAAQKVLMVLFRFLKN